MGAGEAVVVAVLGEDQVQPALGQVLGPGHSPGRDRAQPAGQPGLRGQRRHGVLVDVPDRRRALALRREDEQQFGVVDEQQVRAGRLLGHRRPRGAQRAEPAPPDRAGNGDGAQGTPRPFGVT